MGRKAKSISVRFFTADGVEVNDFWDLASPKREEMIKKFVGTLARQAARQDHLAMMKGENKKPRKRILTPSKK